MEKIAKLHIEIARDVAKKLLEAQAEFQNSDQLTPVTDTLEYPLIVGI
jgi:hypothetical protein